MKVTARSFLELATPLPFKLTQALHWIPDLPCNLSSGVFASMVMVPECQHHKGSASPCVTQQQGFQGHRDTVGNQLSSLQLDISSPGNHSAIPWVGISDPPLVIFDATGWEILQLVTSPSWQEGNLILTRSIGHGITNKAHRLRHTATAPKIWVSTVSWMKQHKSPALSGLQSKLCEGTTEDFPGGPEFFHLALEH